jgi:hypothetical protein
MFEARSPTLIFVANGWKTPRRVVAARFCPMGFWRTTQGR